MSGPPPYDEAAVQRAARSVAAAGARDPYPPLLPMIPQPLRRGRRVACPSCDHEPFRRTAAYELHWRMQHGRGLT